MKKIINLTLIASLSISTLIGCSSKEDTENKEKETIVTQVSEETESIDKLEIKESDSPEKAEIKNLYNEINSEYSKQKVNYNSDDWTNYVTDFKIKCKNLSEKIEVTGIDNLILANADLTLLWLDYTKELEGTGGNAEETRNRVKEYLK